MEASAAVVFERVAAKALEEALARIIRKASEGKRLSDSEVALLVMGLMLRRLDDLKSYVDSRFDSVEKRLDDLKGYADGRFNAVEGRLGALEKRLETVEGRLDTVYSEVSSIKTDIIKMMRELLERAYGGRG
ncbi:MAG: hypothetical protein LM576_07365 [Thermofilum sp.]|nr:hypothetical protein [Thermofilum sp.]